VTAEFTHLHPSQQEIAQLSNEERVAWIRQERWIQYPRAKRILDRLAELVDYPPRDRMPCLVIYGVTGRARRALFGNFCVTSALSSIRSSAGHASPWSRSRCLRRPSTILSTHYRADYTALAASMFARWSQENFYK
jgi:hypothetical protein